MLLSALADSCGFKKIHYVYLFLLLLSLCLFQDKKYDLVVDEDMIEFELMDTVAGRNTTKEVSLTMTTRLPVMVTWQRIVIFYVQPNPLLMNYPPPPSLASTQVHGRLVDATFMMSSPIINMIFVLATELHADTEEWHNHQLEHCSSRCSFYFISLDI